MQRKFPYLLDTQDMISVLHASSTLSAKLIHLQFQSKNKIFSGPSPGVSVASSSNLSEFSLHHVGCCKWGCCSREKNRWRRAFWVALNHSSSHKLPTWNTWYPKWCSAQRNLVGRRYPDFCASLGTSSRIITLGRCSVIAPIPSLVSQPAFWFLSLTDSTPKPTTGFSRKMMEFASVSTLIWWDFWIRVWATHDAANLCIGSLGKLGSVWIYRNIVFLLH